MVVSFDKYGEQLKKKAASLDEPIRQFYRKLILVAWNIGRNGMTNNRFLQSLLPRFELDILKFRKERTEPLEEFAGTVSSAEAKKARLQARAEARAAGKKEEVTKRPNMSTRLALRQLDSSTRHLSEECDGIEEITCGVARALLIGFRKEIAAIDEMRERTRQEIVESLHAHHAAPAAGAAGSPILAAAAAPEDGFVSTSAARRPAAVAATAAASCQSVVPPFVAETSFECGDCRALHSSEDELASHRLRHYEEDIDHEATSFTPLAHSAEPTADDVVDVTTSTSSSEVPGRTSILATLLNQPLHLPQLNTAQLMYDCRECSVQFMNSHEQAVHNATTHNAGSRDRARPRATTRQRLVAATPEAAASTAVEQVLDDPATFAAAAAAATLTTSEDNVYNSSFLLFADAADAAGAAAVDGAAAALAERTCPECGSLFKNDRGVTMHMGKMHKEAAAARRSERAKTPRDRSRSRSRAPSTAQSRAPSRAPSVAPARSRASSVVSKTAAPTRAPAAATPRAHRRKAAQQRESAAATAGQGIDDDDEDYTPVLFDRAASRAYRTAAISAYQLRERQEREAALATTAATPVDDVITIDDDDDDELLHHSEVNPAPEIQEEATVAPPQAAPEPAAPATRREDARGRPALTPAQGERLARISAAKRAAPTPPKPPSAAAADPNSPEAIDATIERVLAPGPKAKVAPARQSRATTTSRATTPAPKTTPMTAFDAALRGIDRLYVPATASRATTPTPAPSRCASRSATPAPRYQSFASASISRAPTPAPTTSSAAASRATTPVPHRSTGVPASRSATPAPPTHHRVSSDRAKTLPPAPGAASRAATPAATTSRAVTPQCTECGKPFTTERGLSIHIGQQHKENKEFRQIVASSSSIAEVAAKRKAEQQRAASCAPSAKKSRASRSATTAPSAPIDAAPINMFPRRWKHALPPVIPVRKSGGSSLMSKARRQASETSRRYASTVKRN
ncbi:hypothetical protein PRIPAC_85905 [Pristionchus pacificus]|uniref:C2H2-type domain-containing protein n=1 Tax=Pristionchus pacificus TaxID=54126 RepID=A0A2A6BP89_PRIPA|nr:hypothetical protein PRIPAC_85905 [Pristionchus pacificus]|eukprot:PDM67591.1 hypothetical protein PRIPAC_49008 [Pristionchus pacificus]